jgi:OOP family OmpA-OmpF porin
MKKLFALGMCLVFAIFTFAQTPDKKWNIGIHGGMEQYFGDLGHDFYQLGDQPTYGLYGLSVSRYLFPQLDVSLFGTHGQIGYIQRAPDTGRFRASMSTLNLILRVNILGPQAHVRPYIFGGVGAMMFDAKYSISEKQITAGVPLAGGGFNFRIGEMITLQLQETMIYASKDNIDGVVANHKDVYFLHTAGLSFNLGKKKDADKDGVANDKDKCPDTPEGIAVNDVGCALDRDKDGVADYQDECPDVTGLASLNGCPDADKDGVVDIHDKCADTKPGYKVDTGGCPLDDDKDALVNEDDRCPDAAGPAGLKGCPDSDGDGIADIDDRCPTVKGVMTDNNGCPESSKDGGNAAVANRVYFDFNTSKMSSVSVPQLDALAEIMKKHETGNFIISGYADDLGDAGYNMQLSKERAEAVKRYLISKGVPESRLIANGYGETAPSVDNKTKSGRAQNRRVEITSSH